MTVVSGPKKGTRRSSLFYFVTLTRLFLFFWNSLFQTVDIHVMSVLYFHNGKGDKKSTKRKKSESSSEDSSSSESEKVNICL